MILVGIHHPTCWIVVQPRRKSQHEQPRRRESLVRRSATPASRRTRRQNLNGRETISTSVCARLIHQHTVIRRPVPSAARTEQNRTAALAGLATGNSACPGGLTFSQQSLGASEGTEPIDAVCAEPLPFAAPGRTSDQRARRWREPAMGEASAGSPRARGCSVLNVSRAHRWSLLRHRELEASNVGEPCSEPSEGRRRSR